MKTVQLRNQAGQFCTLEEFCADEPQFSIVDKPGLGNCERVVTEGAKRLVDLRRVREIIDVFNIPKTGSMHTSRVIFYSNGTYSGPDTISFCVAQSKSHLKEARELLQKWHATSYEVAD